MATLGIVNACLLLLAALAASALSAGYSEQRIQCPYLGMDNCTASDGLAFSDGCKVIVCIGWRSAVTEPRQCRPPSGPAELARCQRLSERLARMQGRSVVADTLVSCPQFAGVDLCASADPFFSYHDGCNYHLCDGNGGAITQTTNSCPSATSPEQLFFCSSNFNSVVWTHNSRHACSAQVNNAERICKLMWPGYRFGDPCYGGNDFVCGRGGSVLMRPPAHLCPLAEASESIKCREVARQVSDLLSDSRSYTCPQLQYPAVCTDENRGFVYNDGCNQILCDGEASGLNEGRVCKLPFDEDQVAGRDFCAAQVAIVERQIGQSRRRHEPCVTPDEACVGPASEGESYFNGCNYCTCLGHGRAQCVRRQCAGFYGSAQEFRAHCDTAAYRLE